MQGLFTGFREAASVRKQGKVVTSLRDQQQQGLVTTSRLKEPMGRSDQISGAAAARRAPGTGDLANHPLTRVGSGQINILTSSSFPSPINAPNGQSQPETRGQESLLV